jgi:hypothetical protein
MPRFIVLLILGYLIYRFLKRIAATPAARTPPPDVTPIGYRPIAACALCGVHLPIEDSVTAADGRTFCCEAHSRQAHVPGH